MTVLTRVRRWGAVLLHVCGAVGLAPPAFAQRVVFDGTPPGVLPSITPLLQLRAEGLGPDRPLLVNVQFSLTADFAQVVFDTAFTKTDSVFAVQITRPLPSEAVLYWRARVRAFAGPIVESAVIGPRTVPAWLRLVSPNSPAGDGFEIRRPQFVWRSAPVLASLGPWTYELELLNTGRPDLAVAGLRDTTYRPTNDLQANTSYRWNVRASLPGGASIRAYSVGSFVITDPPLPTTTLLFQNFPNPFPTASAFSTCFWFDVGEPGATISLDVLDLRGNLVKSVVPGGDGVQTFAPGRYGRGLPGASSNCDNRFVWDGTASDGRIVAPGVYIARFRANTGATTIRRIVFTGR